jgi:hypothetical protein
MLVLMLVLVLVLLMPRPLLSKSLLLSRPQACKCGAGFFKPDGF